jgi:ribosomal-protein-alanine N-acetyltransferase
MLVFNFNPFPVIETQRLILRKPVPVDIPAWFKMRSNEENMRYIGRLPAKDISEVESLFQLVIADIEANKHIGWVVCEKENPAKFVGMIGFHRIKVEHHRAEVGYMIEQEFQGKGYGKESVQAIINYAFDTMHIHNIEADIDKDNIVSERLLQSLGFVKEGHFKESFYFEGTFIDSVIYSLLKSNIR